MVRLFVAEALSVDKTIRASKEHTHYLEKVMRVPIVSVGLFNNKDGEFLATYEAGYFNITSQIRVFEHPPKKALAFGLIKSHRLSWLIEKSCELGVTDLFPLITQRVQSQVFKEDRYQRILIEAAEQCGRIDLPHLREVSSLDTFLRNLPAEYSWHFGSFSSSSVLKKHENQGYIVGPEGGMTEKEEQTLTDFDIIPFSMGSLTLRAETAGLWCLSQFA